MNYHVLLIILLSSSIASHSHDTFLYDVLDLSFSASEDDIKRAYQTLSKKHHPDRSGSSHMYVKVTRAYEVLSNRTKRHIYDTDGLEEVERYEQAAARGYVQQRYNKMKPKVITLRLTLEDAYKGTERNITVSRNSLCSKCKGTGAKNGELKVCSECGGAGVKIERVRTGFGIMQMQTRCPRCGGKGRSANATCPVCGGRRMVTESKSFKVGIDRGVDKGDEVLFEGEGDAVVEALPGDVRFVLDIGPHARFRREADDLYTSLEISFDEAMFGFSKNITHLDDRTVEISKTGVSQHNSFIVVKGEGMPRKDSPQNFGDLYVEVLFKLPLKINEKQREILNAIFE